MGTVNSWNTWAQVILLMVRPSKVPTTENRGNRPYTCAWARASSCLGSSKVADKSNEITAIPALLELLDLAGCIITIDAWVHKLQLQLRYIMPKRITFSHSKTIPHFMDKLKIGLSKQSLKDLKVSTSAMTREWKRTSSYWKRQVWCVQFLNYHLYIINDCGT